jgi:hypothetical protein
VTDDELRNQLRDLEEQMAELRRSAAEIRQRVGQGWDAPQDQADVATALTEAEEQEAFLRVLEDRRQRLLERLGTH